MPMSAIEVFITRWRQAAASERANYQMFLSELCDLVGVPRPNPSTGNPELDSYVIDKPVSRTLPDGTTTTGFIDLYKAGCFVLEAKQGSNDGEATVRLGHGRRGSRGWDTALERAYHQADGYIKDLPAKEGRPPFLIVCDVGHCIDLYAEFSCTGGTYIRFPDPLKYRIHLDDLREPRVRELLKQVWTTPLALDPSRHAAAVTREVARRLGEFSKTLEADGHSPEVIAPFVQRCLFTMFAEDIGLLPAESFITILKRCLEHPEGCETMLRQLWGEMATGTTFSVLLSQPVNHFNGGLFDHPETLPLRKAQIQLLLDSASADWSAVEPAIFGTLLERALDPRERHKLGAHYTPRAYVERLVNPVVIQPLRDQWFAVKAAAAQLCERDEGEAALKLVNAFHIQLCTISVLDPACGSGNFLYVTLELLKRLEGEVLDLYQDLGGSNSLDIFGFRIRPEQFHGLEVNPRAVAIAQLVLWIGYFQWHRRTTGKADSGDRPLLPKQHTIIHQDAVLAYTAKTPRLDADGEPVTIWNGFTTKTHPVTGKEVPDDTARIPVYDYAKPTRPNWPKADYIVGNPPFIGASRMRDALGDGYTEALRLAWKGDVPDSADFVMYWWSKAAELLAVGKIRRFGFITTNSIHQTFNRRVLEPFLADVAKPIHLAFAIPDHPWVDSTDGAAVRIAMTVAAPGKASGTLATVIRETELDDGENTVELAIKMDIIAADLKTGADLTACGALKANSEISCPGVKLHGAGFIITPEQAKEFGLGSMPGLDKHICGYRNGRDLTDKPRKVMIIDAFGLSEAKFREQFPAVYQHVLTTVKPERDQNKRDTYRKNWWIFGEPRGNFRPALANLAHYIATVETSKHRFFTFLDKSILPDNMLVNIAVDDAWVLGVLSSFIHVQWALAKGGTLEDRPRYNKSVCFETFPFPAASDAQKARIRKLGEGLDAHRKRQQALHPELTLTGMYNVLEKLRNGEALNAKEKKIHDDGLVSILAQLYEDLDGAVLDAYGWNDLADQPAGSATLIQEILTRLVALNKRRTDEEARGTIRWLRPDYQAPAAAPAPAPAAGDLDLPEEGETASVSTIMLTAWPESLPEQFAVIKRLLATTAYTPDALAARFGGRATAKRKSQIQAVLATLQSLGQL